MLALKYFKYLFNYIFSFFYDIYYLFFGSIKKRISGLTYYQETKLYPDYLKQGNMAESVKFLAQKHCRGKGVDIGTGRWLFPGARAVENNDKENAYLIQEHDQSLDFVFSSHCLEHLEEWPRALREWRRVLKSGGVLFLYLPHPSCRMWQKQALNQHRWNPDPLMLSRFLEQELAMEIIEVSFLPDGYLSFVVAAKKL